MSYTADELIKMAVEYEQTTSESLLATAKKKEKKKLDPKAKVRNKPSPVVPAERAKDKKDHFPLGSEDQARNALARVMQYDKVPPWYKGSLQGLQEAVRRKVKSKYPGIEVTTPGKKKSSLEADLLAFAQEAASPPPPNLPPPPPPPIGTPEAPTASVEQVKQAIDQVHQALQSLEGALPTQTETDNHRILQIVNQALKVLQSA